MQSGTFGGIITSILTTLISNLLAYIPQFFGGLLILVVGLFLASVLKKAVKVFFRVVKLEKWLEEAKVAKDKEVRVWTEIFAELVRWSVVILFLVPAAESWGVPRVTAVLNQILLYLPNVFVAVIVGLVGMVIANLTHDIVKQGAKDIGSKAAKSLANIARYAILFFTGLIVLNQLGVASDLIRILFTGIVAMMAIAGGLAFGLGGKEMASGILQDLKKKLS